MASLLTLISWIGKKNIAEDIGDDDLKKLANRVLDNYSRDFDSMADWSEAVDEGQKIARQENNAKSEPWEGASNFKSPVILSASVAFGDRASTELLRGQNIVKVEVIGSDDQGIKKTSSENVTQFMNWQLNHQMEDWRDKQECLLYELPSVGSVFKKTFFDPIDGINKSDVIHYPDFVVNQATTSMEECKSFSIPMDVSLNEVIEKQAANLWLDIELYPENSEGDEGSNEQQEVEHSIDNEEKFIEQNCFFDLDDDGYEEPYIVTVHERTAQVVRIVARFDRADVFVTKNGAIVNLQNLKKETEKLNEQGFNVPVDLSDFELVRIKADQNIIKYDFIKSTEGTFLGVGYYHLLSSLSKSINSTTNLLMDAGVLANLQGGFLAKGFRQRMGNYKTNPGAWISTDISAVDLRNGIVPHQFKEPSSVLFALNEDLKKQAADFSVNLDLQGVLSPNAPATTTLALIQESMMPVGAIMRRIIRAESKEFQRFYILNQKFTDPILYKRVLDRDDAQFKIDFDLESMSISPTASSEMSSKMQRIQRAEILITQAPNIALEGGDTRPIWENWFDAIGADNLINQVWPDPEQMNQEQEARLQSQQQQQRKQDQLLAIDIDHKERLIVSTEQDIQSKVAERRANVIETMQNLKKIESDTILNLEKAETQHTKNDIDIYTSQLNSVRTAIDFAQKEIDLDNNERERENAERLFRQTDGQPQQPPDFKRAI